MMSVLRYMTSGESHGPQLTLTVSGMPSNLPVDSEAINRDLKRRQGGYGRGGRMKIESDAARIVAGVRHGFALGSPITMVIENRDWRNWTEIMSPEPQADTSGKQAITRPRPGWLNPKNRVDSVLDSRDHGICIMDDQFRGERMRP